MGGPIEGGPPPRKPSAGQTTPRTGPTVTRPSATTDEFNDLLVRADAVPRDDSLALIRRDVEAQAHRPAGGCSDVHVGEEPGFPRSGAGIVESPLGRFDIHPRWAAGDAGV
ncbi:hypothetical protein GCM10010211_81590 [Streptomyces albospinus]|uniref:Uncharacterized protein n=1 Tax=Streptomyces albospinus TaxID=285515 RepID=A0ABQ2VPC0_9ACTN|nr:hypothetical protein GCM10010211_81590 [Streptomyces albospinus]